MSGAPPALRLSATVLLLRDGAPGLEVFMVQRHHQIDFVAGALVFPGGKVEPEDAGDGEKKLTIGAEADYDVVETPIGNLMPAKR